MFRLTREIRFTLNGQDDPQLRDRPSNGYGGFPTPTQLGRYYTLRITLAVAQLEAHTGMLLNVRWIDQTLRERAIPLIARSDPTQAIQLVAELTSQLRDVWKEGSLQRVELCLSPFLSLQCLVSEYPMTRLSQKFEFAASHRLFNPELDNAANERLYGKCANPHGHGHNFEVQVTLKGLSGQSNPLANLPQLERIVNRTVIDRFDHKHLNLEVPEFQHLIPSVENIAKVIYTLLKPALAEHAELASVTVWETPKTWCEYSE